MKKSDKGIAILVAAVSLLFLLTGPAMARSWMKHKGHRVRLGDSVAQLVTEFGEPKMKIDVGEVKDSWRNCKVQLWIYEFPPWRYEVRVSRGRIMNIDRSRIRRSR